MTTKPKRKRRTKAEMEAARSVANAFSTIGGNDTPKPKRKRRTKVQMERARKKAAKEQAEKDFVIPKSTQKV